MQFTKALRQGMTDQEVMNLQKLLMYLGYMGKQAPISYFGPATAKALRQFQCDKRIVCSGTEDTTGSGIVGAKTRIALNAVASENTPLVQPAPTGQLSDAARQAILQKILELTQMVALLQKELMALQAKGE
jgi:peptidoglycan hydrolase-like protein with peptidoglycan-binding domain